MKKIFIFIALSCAITAVAQQSADQTEREARMRAEMEAAQQKYYANADTCIYGVRYVFDYLYNKAQGMRFLEDRIVLVRPEETLDMSWEGFGEHRWRMKNSDPNTGDMTLHYRLTPDFYFYNTSTDSLQTVYRVLTEEFNLGKERLGNDWKITDRVENIAGLPCRKATLEKGGRQWTAWFTDKLPYQAAPRDFGGLPGVIIDLSDADGEVGWHFFRTEHNLPDHKLYIKHPEKYAALTSDKARRIIRLYGRSEPKYVQESGIYEQLPAYVPEMMRPSTGLDACNIDNPIVKE